MVYILHAGYIISCNFRCKAYSTSYLNIIILFIQLDYFIIKIDGEKLRHQWKDFEAIDLNYPAIVKNNNQIYILQHPYASTEVKMSSSPCQIVGA